VHYAPERENPRKPPQGGFRCYIDLKNIRRYNDIIIMKETLMRIRPHRGLFLYGCFPLENLHYHHERDPYADSSALGAFSL